MELDDAQIMYRVQNGQTELFDTLVLRYRRALLNVAHSKLGDSTWAEDIVQETFLAAFAARHTYNSQFAFRTWLWTILLNLCRRHLKRHHRRPKEIVRSALAVSADPTLWEPVIDESGLSRMLLDERREQLSAMLDRLPEVQADALRLRFYGELKFEEIARSMKCSLNGAKLRVRTGLFKLSQMIREQEDVSQ